MPFNRTKSHTGIQGLTIPSCNYLTERRRTSLGSLSSSPCSSPHTPEGTVSPDCLPWTDKEVMPPPMPPHRGLSIPPTTVSLSPSLAHHASCPNIIISDFCDPGSTPSPTPEDYGYFSYTRSLSTCSSTTSSMSWDEDLTDAPKLPKKVSKWKKIRNAIHWSPFVQTYHKYKYPWVQLAGHQGNFKPGHQGTIYKKLSGNEERCLRFLMKDVLRPFVPELISKTLLENGKWYLEMQDLLASFISPCCVMDLKIGIRTYLEEELAGARQNPRLRKDMYAKMVSVSPDEPTEEEHQQGGVTKPRYMVWRESISSTSTLAFRIEGIKNADNTTSRNFHRVKGCSEITAIFARFLEGYPHAAEHYLCRLKSLRQVLQYSRFFQLHELIGSSLLFVHDGRSAGIWMIDFAKSQMLPPGVNIFHDQPWLEGNHEDGYLTGLDNLISIFDSLIPPTS